MTAAPAEYRILTALLLQPMDSRQLSRALTMPLPSVCRALTRLHERLLVRRNGVTRSNRRPAINYQLTAGGRVIAQQALA